MDNSDQAEDGLESGTVRAAERALDILLCFSAQTPALSMTQISKKMHLNKSTIHRLLATLEKKRFIRRDPDTGIYRLGIQLLQMANLSLDDMNIRHISLPYMKRLVEEFRETVDLAILDGEEVIFIDSVEGPQRVKLAASPGQHLPAYNTASGKAILAGLPESETNRIFYTYNDPTEPLFQEKFKAFIEDLKVTNARGYALDCEVLEPGVNAVASAILGLNRKPVASLAIAGPAYRLECRLLNEIGTQLVDTAGEISQKILAGN